MVMSLLLKFLFKNKLLKYTQNKFIVKKELKIFRKKGVKKFSYPP
ncbi:hypothetical protein EVI01_16380 [Enterococcus villorum]|uniref:Uncharacterized protein n=2 Tax=Enterococcus villorum TaxID=112904 RepID=A0A511J2S9_9ENTE|nr:hypothetical protein UAO_00566 [Enterococcus villorum ATCC 700913]EOW76612.1 hypothetical protein I591_01920 [Enterococcus villorum ATCC 700913]GEL92301.1 hypothetical protein EVI01_16380 [Enterococcus villorum]